MKLLITCKVITTKLSHVSCLGAVLKQPRHIFFFKNKSYQWLVTALSLAPTPALLGCWFVFYTRRIQTHNIMHKAQPEELYHHTQQIQRSMPIISNTAELPHGKTDQDRKHKFTSKHLHDGYRIPMPRIIWHTCKHFFFLCRGHASCKCFFSFHCRQTLWSVEISTFVCKLELAEAFAMAFVYMQPAWKVWEWRVGVAHTALQL